MAQNQSDSPRWHVEKRINLGDIITSMTIFASVMLYIGNIDKRVSVVEATVIAQKEIDARQDTQAKQDKADTMRVLERLDAKMDRLIEGRTK